MDFDEFPSVDAAVRRTWGHACHRCGAAIPAKRGRPAKHCAACRTPEEQRQLAYQRAWRLKRKASG